MLRVEAGQVLSLWDEVLPVEARELPEDLSRIDGLLADPGLLAPIRAHWDGEAQASGRSAVGHGRPTIAMATALLLPGDSDSAADDTPSGPGTPYGPRNNAAGRHA